MKSTFLKRWSQNNPYFEKGVKKYSQGFAPLFEKWIQIVDLLLTVRIVLINELEQ